MCLGVAFVFSVLSRRKTYASWVNSGFLEQVSDVRTAALGVGVGGPLRVRRVWEFEALVKIQGVG